MNVRQLFPALVVMLAAATPISAGLVENVSPQAGETVASVSWIDETGGAHRMSDFIGYPVILLPVYTRCRTACVMNLAQLKSALTDAAADPTQFRVLLFRSTLPIRLLSWPATGRAKIFPSAGRSAQPPSQRSALLESIGFQYGEAGKEFTHPNMLVFLDGNLHIAKWIYGNNYTGNEIAAALRVAAGESDWIGRHSDVLYALLLFSATLCCVALSYYLLQLLVLRRAGRVSAGNPLF